MCSYEGNLRSNSLKPGEEKKFALFALHLKIFPDECFFANKLILKV